MLVFVIEGQISNIILGRGFLSNLFLVWHPDFLSLLLFLFRFGHLVGVLPFLLFLPLLLLLFLAL